MHFNKLAYVVLVLATGWAFAAASLLRADQSSVLLGIGLLALAALTFPLGFLGFMVGFGLVYVGFINQFEMLLFATPLCALLGYLQWCRVLPAIFRRRPN